MPDDETSDVVATLKVLVTGFVPFGGDPYNASGVTAKWLDGQRIDVTTPGGRVCAHVVGRGDVPVVGASQNVGHSGADAVVQAITAERPDVVICLGQGENTNFRVERKAHDPPDAPRDPHARDRDAIYHDPRIPRDPAKGYRATYDSTFDVVGIVAAIGDAGGEVRASEDAGMYVCEDVLYHVLRYAAGAASILAAGFIHVPRYVLVDIPIDRLIPPGAPIRSRPDFDASGARPFTPNDQNIAPGETAVPQSLIDDAIHGAVAAAVAGLQNST